jgi:hypothetical protein
MLFHHIQSKALQIATQHNLKFLEGGIGKNLTCITVQNKSHKATGVALTPQNEGNLNPFAEDSLENLLIQGNAYDVGKRTTALATINAISQWYLQKEPPICHQNLRIVLSEHILNLTCKESKIVFIGHLKPVVNALRQNGRNPIVFCRQ